MSNFTRRQLALGAAASMAAPAATRAAMKGRIKQSIVQWCFATAGWSVEKTCSVAQSLGCKSVELVGPEDWPTLKRYGLECAIAPNGMPDPPFVRGFNNPRHQKQVIEVTKKTIDQAADFGCKRVIAFNGYKWNDAEDPSSGEISLEEGAKNTVQGLKALAGPAEKKGITVCLEMLNTRDDSHPMKGHPGYQGDDLDYCADIVAQVGSENVKLLFDIYHVQVMNGDVMRRLVQYSDLIGHVHTAGNPGRKELDDEQEIHYPGIMRALVKMNYEGFVGQEFIPTADPLAGLTQAVERCDV